MSKPNAKSAVGRQTHLPLSRAFVISLNSLKIRFWRSIITAGGIFLGIAFLAVVLTQSFLQWPSPEKVDPGCVRVGGQVVGPGDFDVWKRIPVQEGIKAGISPDVIARVASPAGDFSLSSIVGGQLEAKRSAKNLKRVTQESEAVGKIKDKLAFFTDVAGDKDLSYADAAKYGVPAAVVSRLKNAEALREIKDKLDFSAEDADKNAKTDDAVKFGIPRDVVERVIANKGTNVETVSTTDALKVVAKRVAQSVATFKGSLLAEVLKEQPSWASVLYYDAGLDQDINVDDAVREGVPRDLASHLAGDGRTFKAGPLGDAIKQYPYWVTLWTVRLHRNTIFTTVAQAPIDKLADAYSVTLADALADAKNFAKDADQSDIMIVNPSGGRRVQADLTKNKAAGAIRLKSGDSILIPELSARYRAVWLVIMALLVCTVGITNNMLMSITERFKEIGTMKCLGALDKFVVTLFMLESGMMGIAASVLGWAAGFIVIMLFAGFTKGWGVVWGIGPIGALETFGISVGAGLLITSIATIAPAMRAANMPPAIALRAEI